MNSEKSDKQSPRCIDEREKAVERVLRELGRRVRESGRTQRAIEIDNGFARGYLSQVLHGHMTLTVRHVFGVLAALGTPPAEFFGALFSGAPEEGEMLSEIRQRMARYDSALEELEQKGLLSPGRESELERDPE